MSESLPQRMREAAKVLDEASARKQLNDDSRVPWTAFQLRYTADRFESEDNTTAELESLVEELAKTLLETCHDILRIESSGPLFDDAREGARKLIDAGWTKQATS